MPTTQNTTSNRTLKSDLEWYEELFPENAYRCVSLVLTGQTLDDDKDPFSHLIDLLHEEIDEHSTEEEREDLERILEMVMALSDRRVTSFKMRKYETQNRETPEDVNRAAAENKSAMSLAAHSASICAKASVGVFQMTDDMYAVVWNEKSCYGGVFDVQIGPWSGGFEVAITDDVDSFLEREFYSENWRRSQHFVEGASPKVAP